MYLFRAYFSVTLKYVLITAAAVVVYVYLMRLPEARGVLTPGDLWHTHGSIIDGLRIVWPIFAWAFGVQTLIQIIRVFKRMPRDAGLRDTLRHGAWISAHAGLFEEIIFRLYAFLSFIIALRFARHFLGLSFITNDWIMWLAILLGSLFFRSAHIHYGKLSKANVFVIGLVMFWLTLHFGLPTAIIAHFLYDFCVFAAIALTAPLQPRAVVTDEQ